DPNTHERFVATSNYSDGKINTKLFSQKELVYNNRTLPITTDFSPDEKKVLIADQEEPIYRRSSKAYYYVFDLQTRQVTPVSKQEGKQLYATFSPDGSKVAFVRSNNLFYTDL